MATTTRSNLGRAKVVTSRELSLDTAAIVEDVVTRNRTAIITKHGRLIAALVSLLSVTTQPEAESLASPAARAFLDTLDAESADSNTVELLDDVPCEDELDTSNSRSDVTVRLPRASVVTMRRLNQQTGAVLNEVRSRSEATLLSKHGRLIAALFPVPADIESQLLENVAAQALVHSLGSELRDEAAYGVSPEAALADLAMEDKD